MNRRLGILLATLIGAALGAGCAPADSTIPASIQEQIQRAAKNTNRDDESGSPTPGPSGGYSIPMREEWTMQQTVSDALRRIGSAAVPALVRSLKSTDPDVRLRAAEILGRMGPEAKESVPDLIERLGDDDPRVRKMAIRALGQIGPAAAAAVPALIRVLHEEPHSP